MDDVGMEIARERLRRDLENLPTREDLAKAELKNGVDPKWVSHKYRVDLERCVNYAKALAAQRETKNETA